MKKEIASDYFETEEGKFIKHQSKKIRIEGILCFALGLIYLLFDVYKKEAWQMYLLTIGLFAFGTYFIYKSYSIKNFKKKTCRSATKAPQQVWLRGLDSNQRPSGYEPDKLPTAQPRNIIRKV